MTPKESKTLQYHLKAAAAILLKNTPSEELKDFASIELAVREHVVTEVAPAIGNFFDREHRNHSGTHQNPPNQPGEMENY